MRNNKNIEKKTIPPQKTIKNIVKNKKQKNKF